MALLVAVSCEPPPPSDQDEPEIRHQQGAPSWLGPVDDGTHLLVLGQSNALTWRASPALSTTPEGDNRRAVDSAFEPLLETEQESPASAFANTLRALCGEGREFIASTHACGNCAYSKIGTGSRTYADMLAQITASNRARGGNPHRVLAGLLVHGESDEREDGLAALYAERIASFQSDIERDVRTVTGQGEPFTLFAWQIGSWNRIMRREPYRPCKTCLEVLEASHTTPGRVLLVGPGYPYTYQDQGNDVHLTNTGARMLGEQAAFAACQMQRSGRPWVPLSITRADWQGRTIRLSYSNPTGTPLVFDTHLVIPRHLPGKGFTIICPGSVDVPTVLEPMIIDAVTIDLPLTHPAFTGCEVAYAYNNGHSGVGAEVSLAPGGNLRDSNPEIRSARNLYNWAVVQRVPISNAPPPPRRDGQATGLRSWTFAVDGADCQPSPTWRWLSPDVDVQRPNPADGAGRPTQLLLDTVHSSYTCGAPTDGLRVGGLGASRVNRALAVTAAGCFHDASSAYFPTIPDAAHALVRLVLKTSGMPGARTLYRQAQSGAEYLIIETAGDTLTIRVRSREGRELARVLTGLHAGTWHLVDLFYRGECSGPGTRPCLELYLDGHLASAGAEHSADFGAIETPSGTISLFGSADCASDLWHGTLAFLGIAIGDDASWFTGASHAGDWRSLWDDGPEAIMAK